MINIIKLIKNLKVSYILAAFEWLSLAGSFFSFGNGRGSSGISGADQEAYAAKYYADLSVLKGAVQRVSDGLTRRNYQESRGSSFFPSLVNNALEAIGDTFGASVEERLADIWGTATSATQGRLTLNYVSLSSGQLFSPGTDPADQTPDGTFSPSIIGVHNFNSLSYYLDRRLDFISDRYQNVAK